MCDNRCSIAIVDDAALNIDILKEALKKDYRLLPALNGATALKIARASPPPDLILLDILMPGIDGFEVLAQLQQDPSTRDIPVIFITSRADETSEVRGFQYGAVDYITKPFNPVVVRARVATHLALRQARQQLTQHNEKLRDEKQVIEDIIIRMRTHRQFDERFLRFLTAPADRANGDILLSAFTPDGRHWVLVGDFVGHGLRAAVAAPLVAQVFYSQAAAGDSMVATIAAINVILCRQLPTGFFMAFSAVELAPARDQLWWWSGGMPESVLLDACNDQWETLTAPSLLPLGILEDIDIAGAGAQLMLTPGSRLYLFSDGAVEVDNASDELFGVPRLLAFLKTCETSRPLTDLLGVLKAFRGARSFHDDITLVEISL
ncbi:fused response regulator/phosphatase [Rhabdochromatium marinum]|uniref:fused response regulator/phosphatase n=1 Tax=Rhabdochromatium marinum TaxID=48729 RepID=UPI0019036753|nr:fused response regulator/phosphatase [Rhabdochromatium marinum]MBK1648460.1 hypothetical protein [Rhabdochromatium marinum]